jgi:hypothetical protein
LAPDVKQTARGDKKGAGPAHRTVSATAERKQGGGKETGKGADHDLRSHNQEPPVITDPQNNFLFPEGVTQGVVGESITANRTVKHVGALFEPALTEPESELAVQYQSNGQLALVASSKH